MLARRVVESLNAKRPNSSTNSGVGELDRLISEAGRRIDQQNRLVHSLAIVGESTTEASFDLSKMHLVHVLLQQMRLRMLLHHSCS